MYCYERVCAQWVYKAVLAVGLPAEKLSTGFAPHFAAAISVKQ